MTGWWQELALQQRTELQAALVCTIYKEMQPGGERKKKNHSTSKQAN